MEQRAQAVLEAERVRLCYGRRVTMMDGEDMAAIRVERSYAPGQGGTGMGSSVAAVAPRRAA